MTVQNIFAHHKHMTTLTNAYHNNRLSSAYLLTGQNGIGKTYFTKQFAHFINCDHHNQCRECENCTLFLNKNHPDFLLIKPDGNFILLDQIKQLIEGLSLKPTYSKKRVVVIKNAHKFNRESANAFLKMLEEPPFDTLIFLTALDETRILDTIRSRCQILRLGNLNPTLLTKIIYNHYEISTNRLNFILSYSYGTIRKTFIQQVDELFALREQTIDILTNLTNQRMPIHLQTVENLTKKSLHGYFLEFCMTWYHDLLIICYGDDNVVNKDRLNVLRIHSKKYSKEQLSQSYSIMRETEKSILGFTEKNLALSSMLVQLKQITEGKPVY